jgi:hypothetical protein
LEVSALISLFDVIEQHFLGNLDAIGEVSAVFDTLNPIPEAAGLYLTFAYALNLPWDHVSNGAWIELLP